MSIFFLTRLGFETATLFVAALNDKKFYVRLIEVTTFPSSDRRGAKTGVKYTSNNAFRTIE